MSENLKQIAQRLKELREISGISLETIAEEFKISHDQYKLYESGEVDIPISFLYEAANRFKVELTALLTGGEPRLHTYSLVHAGKGLSVERRKEYKYQDLAYNFGRKKAEIFHVTVDPRPDAALHHYSHPGQEFTYVLEGSLKIVLDDHEVILNVGDSLYFDSGHSHAMCALNNKPSKFLAVIIQ